jgi:hypothetical protein
MSRPLWFRLVLPLIILSATSLAVHGCWEAGGFFINLSTELLGIVLTVAYVDWVLKAHESAQWSGAESRIRSRLEVLVNRLISGIRNSFGFGPSVVEQLIPVTNDPKGIHEALLRFGKEVLAPVARERLDSLDEAGWRKLATHLQMVWSEAERVINLFGNRLQPRQLELLLDIQQTVQEALTFWHVFPDLAGVPDDQLPRTKTPPEILKAHGYDSTADALRRLIRNAAELTPSTKSSA